MKTCMLARTSYLHTKFNSQDDVSVKHAYGKKYLREQKLAEVKKEYADRLAVGKTLI